LLTRDWNWTDNDNPFKLKVKFTLEKVMEAQRGRTGIALLFL
jgi:hypothetical protein